MAAAGDGAATTTSAGETGRSLEYIRRLIGLLAGIAAVIYITGGIVLALRLFFVGLPTLGVVGQLPQQFLFSIGATQVVAPALILGIVAGLAQLMQTPGDALKRSHHAWTQAKTSEALRRSFLLFYIAAPLVLLAPAAAVAILRDDEVPRRTLLIALLAVVVACALALWVRAALKARRLSREEADKKRDRTEVTRGEWALIFGGGAVSLVPGIWVVMGEQHSGRFFALALAWLVTLLFVLLVPYLRGAIRKFYEDDPHRLPVAVALSCLSSALLAVPALVALASALPLPPATVCTKEDAYRAAGRYVGETKDRVYIGDDIADRIISVPSAEVTRVLVGQSAEHTTLCDRSADGPR